MIGTREQLNSWHHEQHGERVASRSVSLTDDGLKALSLLDGCDGRWNGWSCKEAWPVSKFAWCPSCRS